MIHSTSSEISFEGHVIFDLSGQIPSVEDANRREGVLTFPWQEKPLDLGKFLLCISRIFFIECEKCKDGGLLLATFYFCLNAKVVIVLLFQVPE